MIMMILINFICVFIDIIINFIITSFVIFAVIIIISINTITIIIPPTQLFRQSGKLAGLMTPKAD